MTGKAIPNLYLKWRAVRELIGLTRSDAMVAERFFGPGEGPIKFSKLLRGDYGCANDVAAYLADVINEAIGAHRKRTGLSGAAPVQVRGSDLGAPLFDFTRKLIEAAGAIEDEVFDRAHRALLQDMTLPAARLNQDTRLRIEQFAKDRMFADFEPSGGTGPVVFRPDRDLGRLAVEGLTRPPVAAYVMITRDTSAVARRVWEGSWGEAVMWLPSPFVPPADGADYLLMPKPQPVRNVPGQFTVTAALLLKQELTEVLDPRDQATPGRAMDEIETARFLTNLRRMTDPRQKSRHDRDSLVVVSDSYVVERIDARGP